MSCVGPTSSSNANIASVEDIRIPNFVLEVEKAETMMRGEEEEEEEEEEEH